MGWRGGQHQICQQSEAKPLTCCQDLDQLTQILKVTGVPGTEFLQKLNDKAVSSRWA